MTPAEAAPDGASTEEAGDIQFAVFSADNEAAIHLLETIECKVSPPTLKSDEHAIGYQLSVPSSCDSLDSGRLRWRIGAGPSPALVEKGLCYCEPDILLCPPGRTPSSTAVRRFIKDIHATIHIHPRSRVLLLKTHSTRPIVYEQGDVDDGDLTLDASPRRNTCVLRRQRNYLRFGRYRFVLEFVASDQSRKSLNSQHDKNLDCCYSGLRPSQLLNFIPTSDSETSGNVWLHQKVPNSSIISGVDIHTGLPVAVKKLDTRAKGRQHMRRRLQIATQYKDRLHKGVLGVIDIWCEHKSPYPCLFQKQSEAMNRCLHTFYSVPLAEHNFLNMPWAKTDTNTRLLYLFQTLTGLSEIHRQDVAHGNISPESLLILADTKGEPLPGVSSLPKKAAISLSIQPLGKKPSASVCVAPEVWISKGNLDQFKADIWSLAASWLFAFVRPPSGIKINKESYHTLQKTLDDQCERGFILDPLANLLRQMLAWDSKDRPSAEEALAHEAWVPVLAHEQSVADDRKRKRIEQTQNTSAQTRRARVLSPDAND
ncbi:kinase-like domain-containing protein [Trichoderma sp. SZMC 28014]